MSSGSALIYRFGDFELDLGRFELREHGQPKHLEPQVLSVLFLLVANSDRLVSKDEIIEQVWGGRFISDAAVASRIKAARQALGDDGQQQRFIRTLHGKGFRFAASVVFAHAEDGTRALPGDPPLIGQQVEDRPSIAVLPFKHAGEAGPLSFVAEALADELIADLSRLRWLLVIARGSTFRFRDRAVGCEEIGTALKVRYCLTGTLARAGHGVTIAVELARTSDSAVVWAERFSAGGNEFAELRREILTAVVANLEVRIVQHEIDAARRRPQAGLDAWASYHLGLDHMFRFNKADNAKAAALFEQALLLDPHFSRAFSGLSFTAFQDRFLHYSGDDDATARRARELAEEALRCDPLDPFAHLNLGRALWFDDAVPESIERLGASIALSPNYAQAIYSKSWAEMTLCEADSCDSNAAAALRLSPLDPLRYAMLGVRSMGALLRDDAETAADWGEKAARSPGAHKHIAIIAALGAGAAGRTDRAAHWVKRARELDPHVSGAGFLVSFPFVESDGRERIERGLRDLRL